MLINIILFYNEFLSLKPVIKSKTTLSLLGFLLMIMSLRVSRITGIGFDNIIIRTYVTAVFGCLAAIFFVNWGSLVIKLSFHHKMSYLLVILFGLVGFIAGRMYEIAIVETLSVFILITPAIILMIQIFVFVFKNSPYIRARQRLFVLSVSFLLYAVFEALAVSNMGMNHFDIAALYLGLTIPSRIGMTLSILLPPRLTDFLSKFIR